MAKLKPSIRPSETYTAPNFLRVYTAAQTEPRSERIATIEPCAGNGFGDSSSLDARAT